MKQSIPKIIFYRVKDNQAKIRFICTKAQEALNQEKRLLILVPNPEAGHYIDTLLWRQPEEDFLPHVFTQSSTMEWIAITTQEGANLNQADLLLNLCSHSVQTYQPYHEIYELYDETHPQKLESSKQRLKDYLDKGLFVKEL
ncbi:Conserved hypothetical protein [Candidatus Protochlamydia naegleriophila]|uniref:DNA polymerase III subunit chi n=1 Tax=Candidatus Protochlamydia naegleriophila TaxID=389348 RepID=A0A0U5JBI0_9BACT|nr:DNA polymerase III subunit chi [Candidatus Protochlamydia naegleriophila]CUI16461.1 Conserved hypothetical protein [Candidatus Protochlamydia naegleriophila]